MQHDSGLSPAQLGALIVEGYTAPRASMARVLRMHPDERARLLMVGIGIVVSAMGVALSGPPPDPDFEPGNPMLSYIITVVAGVVQYIAFSWFIGLVCSFAGGAGSAEDSRTLVAWWTLVTSPLPLLMMMALSGGQSPAAAFLLIIGAILSFVLLAAYIAETHQFKSTARVCGVMLALLMVVSFILSSLIPMPVPA